MTDTLEDETLPERPDAGDGRSAAPDRSASTELVNRLVKRRGCTIQEAKLFLEGHTLSEQQELAAGPVDTEPARKERLAQALKQLEDAGISPDDPCPFGAKGVPRPRRPDGTVDKGSPRPKPVPFTWGDVVAKHVYDGRTSSVAALLKRFKGAA